MSYVDLKAAFDSVDRVALRKALKGRDVPHLVLQLLEDLHSQTGAKVRSGGKLSSRFNTSFGVRQGCVLAPALFCIAINWILSQIASWYHSWRSMLHGPGLSRRRSDLPVR